MDDNRAEFVAAEHNVLSFYAIFDKAARKVSEELGLGQPRFLFAEFDEFSKRREKWFPSVFGQKARTRIPFAAGGRLIKIVTEIVSKPSSSVAGPQVRRTLLDEDEAEELRAAWRAYNDSWPLLDARRSLYARTGATDTSEAIRFVKTFLARAGYHKDALQDREGLKIVLDQAVFNVRRSGDNAGAIRAAEKFYRVAKYRPAAIGLSGDLIAIVQLNALIRLGWAAMQDRQKGLEKWAVAEMRALDRDHRSAVGISARLRILSHEGYYDLSSSTPFEVLAISVEAPKTPFFGYGDAPYSIPTALHNAGRHALDRNMEIDCRLNALGERTIEEALCEALDREEELESAVLNARALCEFYAQIGRYEESLAVLERGETLLKQSVVPLAFAGITLERTKARLYRRRSKQEICVSSAEMAGRYYSAAAQQATQLRMFALAEEINLEASKPAMFP